MAYQSGDIWKANVFDKGSRRIVTLCELKDGEWQDCTFPTKVDAEKAEHEYFEFWKED